MVTRLNPLLNKIIELQKIDLEVERLLAEKKKLPLRLQELEIEFQSISDAASRRMKEFEEKQKEKREKDRQLQTGLEMLKRARERLFDVKTNKEYQSLLKEIETSEAKNSSLEDEIINLLDSLDGLEKETKVKEQEFATLRDDYEQEKRSVTEAIESLDRKLDASVRKAEELKRGIPPDLIKKYEKIKVLGHGIAVVPVWKEVCYGCHMAIPPQLYNEVQTSDEIMTCPNCNRIIYWEDRTA